MRIKLPWCISLFLDKLYLNFDFFFEGDLTDAKYKNQRGSTQFIEEWKRYEEVITLCQKYNNNVKWLDVRGNHGEYFFCVLIVIYIFKIILSSINFPAPFCCFILFPPL